MKVFSGGGVVRVVALDMVWSVECWIQVTLSDLWSVVLYAAAVHG